MFREEEKQEIDEILKGITFNDLLKAYEDVMSRKELKVDRVRSSFKAVAHDNFTISDKINYIKEMIMISPVIKFGDIFKKDTTKAEIVVTFLAMLELIKTKVVDISQSENFGEIIITKGNGCDSDETV